MLNIVRSTSVMSPSVSVKRFAMRSTSAARRIVRQQTAIANFREMNRAVEGWCSKMSSTFSPSFMPPNAGIVTPSTCFSPSS